MLTDEELNAGLKRLGYNPYSIVGAYWREQMRLGQHPPSR